jgi:lysophospholipase L1-like esterase
MSKNIFFVILLAIACKPSANDNIKVLKGKDLIAYGRADVSKNGSLELITSACHTGINFSGQKCEIYFSLQDSKSVGYFQYELDGEYQNRISLCGKTKSKITISAKEVGDHELWIYKTTEAHTGPIFIDSIVGDDVAAITKQKMPLIEFIGNSITCGADADTSEFPCDKMDYSHYHNAYYAYGPRVARALNCDFVLNSVSGYGIYRNWNNDGPALPAVYKNLDFQYNSLRKADFTTRHPEIISIALGTNDMSDGDGSQRKPFDEKTFIAKYVDFIKELKAIHPSSKYVLLSSPMMQGERRKILESCLANVKKEVDVLYPKDSKIQIHNIKEMKPSGCGDHPSVNDFKIIAEQLVPFFKNVLEAK